MALFENPFSPVFGGKPGVFFGRESILSSFREALENPGSHYRTMFLTGSRGMGKTALLEQFSRIADSAGLEVIDASYSNALSKCFATLGGAHETVTALEPEIGGSVFGTGANLKLGKRKRTLRSDETQLDELMLAACKKNGTGLLVTIDEIQKMKKRDLELISNAYQLASRKGANVILAVAGLPRSFEKVSKYQGSTYMRRAHHEEIGLFSPKETVRIVRSAISMVNLLETTDEAAEQMALNSKGQPYLLQLMCYHLVEYLNKTVSSKRHLIAAQPYAVVRQDVDEAFSIALGDYKRGACAPIANELPESELKYLSAAARVLDDDRVAAVSDIAAELHADSSKLGSPRARLIERELIVAAGRGKVMFAVPYLSEYLRERPSQSDKLELLREWRV